VSPSFPAGDRKVVGDLMSSAMELEIVVGEMDSPFPGQGYRMLDILRSKRAPKNDGSDIGGTLSLYSQIAL